MNFKKVISVSLCSVMMLSLVCCKPKDFFSNLLNGKNQGGSSNVVISDKVNKDAIFKESTTFQLTDRIDYIDSFNSANGRIYMGAMVYDYPEGEGFIGDYETYDEPAVDGDVNDEPADTEDADAEKTAEGDTETTGETGEADDTEDIVDGDAPAQDPSVFFPEDNYDYQPPKSSLLLINFSNADDIQTVEKDWDSSEYLASKINVDSEGNYYLVFNVTDPESYQETFKLKKLSPAGDVIKETNIAADNSDYFYVRGACTDSQGNTFVVSDSSVQIFDKELNPSGTYKLENDSYINAMMINSKDQFVLVADHYSAETYSSSAMIIDAKGNGKEESGVSEMLNGRSVINGSGYDYYYRTNASVYAFNTGDKKAVEIVNFYDSDIDPDGIYGEAVFIDAEHFIVPGENGASVVLYEKVPADQVIDKEILTLGTVYGSYSVSKQILDFNKNNEKYRIKLIDYSEFSTPDDWMGGSKRFNSDLTSGSSPDIIVPEAYDVQNLIDKGVFTDLSPFMANGNGIKKEDLVENAQTVFARDDKLYCIYPTFSVEAVMLKKKFYKENMTIDDVIAWEQQTGKKAFETSTKSGVLNTFMSLGMDAFLNPQTGKCSFDSDEFIKILEYANTYPAEYSEDDFDDNYYMNYMYVYRNDNALLTNAWVSNFKDYNWNKKYRFGDDEVVLAGIPINGTLGASLNIDAPMGISSKCKNPEAAWEFINSCFQPEYYEEQTWSIPSVESEMDKMIEKSMKHETYVDENGKEVEMPETIWLMDEEVEIKLITKEEAAELKSFVTSVKNIYTWDEELNKIVDEETQGFFQGQRTAKEVAGVIQSRLQIYINEKK
ncbi:MAG: extracellular solute-binding protein [Lachnospiraceae bacterium]|nr:extracellular solute-binding protein [Lachnospiraceae bacterium]